MSEVTPRNQLSFEERQARTAARRAELEPALAQLAVAAKAAYATLRPLAQHVSTVDRDYPLRHQQVHGMGIGGPGGVVADYLMVAFGGHHDLLLYQNFGSARSFTWQFERSLLTDALLSEKTKIEEYPQARRPAAGGGVMGIEVATYTYPEQIGINAMFTDGLCDDLNGYAGAEGYVRAFETDLEAAVTRLA